MNLNYLSSKFFYFVFLILEYFVHLNSKMAQKPKLIYFDFKAKAESIRLAFHIGGMDFEDKRVTREEFSVMKPHLPFGQLPVLEFEDNKVLAQSLAILIYAGKKTGLMPADAMEAAKVIQILSTLEDIYGKFAPTMHEPDQQKKLQMREQLAKETLPFWLSRLNTIIENEESPGCYCVGKNLTVADLQVYVVLSWLCLSDIVEGIPKDICNPYKAILKVIENVGNHPKVKEWNSAHKTK